jgi:RNA polymerase sigma-70 factor (ECF subfamily)
MQIGTEKIWEEFSDRLRKFIFGRVHDKKAIDDILQEVFLRIYANIKSLRNNDSLSMPSF